MYDVADSVRPGQNRISVLLPLCPFSSMEPHGPFPHDHPAKVPNTRLPGYEWGSIICTATYHTSTFSWNLILPPLGDLGPFEEGWGTESLCNVDSSSSTVKHLETGSLALCIVICKRLCRNIRKRIHIICRVDCPLCIRLCTLYRFIKLADLRHAV